VQETLARAIARGHFEERRSAQNHEVLVAAATEAGLDADAAAAVLADGECMAAEVQLQLEASNAAGHHSIPLITFTARAGGEGADAGIFAGGGGGGGVRAELGGARAPEEYEDVLRELGEAVAAAGA
jgi:predicted DsbA family dithiol-disulfide isomerase